RAARASAGGRAVGRGAPAGARRGGAPARESANGVLQRGRPAAAGGPAVGRPDGSLRGPGRSFSGPAPAGGEGSADGGGAPAVRPRAGAAPAGGALASGRGGAPAARGPPSHRERRLVARCAGAGGDGPLSGIRRGAALAASRAAGAVRGLRGLAAELA